MNSDVLRNINYELYEAGIEIQPFVKEASIVPLKIN
jgi:hypothetical protein